MIGKTFNEKILPNRKGILYDSNEIRTHNHLVHLQTNWMWARISLLLLKLHI